MAEFLITALAYDPVAGAVTSQRFGTVGFVTKPTDAPPNAFFENRVVNPGSYARQAFSEGQTSGASEVGAGVIELNNADGGLDFLIEYGIAGRALTIISVPDGFSPYAAATPLFVGVVDQLEFAYRTVTLRMRDRLYALKQPIQPVLYAGTTTSGSVSPAEAEGQPGDLKGQPKPLLYGRARGIPAIAANIFDRIYQISSNALASVDAVYDRGVLLTKGADYADLPALKAATIAAGSYGTCLARGCVRTGSIPVGTLTADATEGATLADRSAARVAQRILLQQTALTAADLSIASFDALHAACGYEVGVWIGTQQTDPLSIVTAVLNSIGGFIVPDRAGVFSVNRLVDPATSLASPSLVVDGIATLEPGQGDGIERVATSDEGAGVPAYQVTVTWGVNYAVQSGTDIDQGNVQPAVKAFLAEERRSAVAADAAVRTVHPAAVALSFDTLLVNEADAIAEAARRLAFYKRRRDRFRVPLRTDFARPADLAAIVSLQYSRFNLASGKRFFVLGIEEDYATGISTLDMIG